MINILTTKIRALNPTRLAKFKLFDQGLDLGKQRRHIYVVLNGFKMQKPPAGGFQPS